MKAKTESYERILRCQAVLEAAIDQILAKPKYRDADCEFMLRYLAVIQKGEEINALKKIAERCSGERKNTLL